MSRIIIYKYSKPISFMAKLIYIFLGVFKMKQKTEQNIISNSFNKQPALPPKWFNKNHIVLKINIKNRPVWQITPKNNHSKHVILFLHGGAYMANISKQHWFFIKQLLIKTKATMIVPDYPLAPQSNCEEVYHFMDILYTEIQNKYTNQPIYFMGDSAGGGLALGFAQKLRNNQLKLPDQLILFSPWLDVTMSNPLLKKLDNKDRILSIKSLKIAGELYADEMEQTDYRISPLYGDFSTLCPISIFTGTYDILYADAQKLKEIVHPQNTELNYYEYPKMFHDWIVIPSLKETKDVIKHVVKLLV